MKVLSNNLFGAIPELINCFLLLPFTSLAAPVWIFCLVPINQLMKFNDSETDDEAGDVVATSCVEVVCLSCANPTEQTNTNTSTTIHFKEAENVEFEVF